MQPICLVCRREGDKHASVSVIAQVEPRKSKPSTTRLLGLRWFYPEQGLFLIRPTASQLTCKVRWLAPGRAEARRLLAGPALLEPLALLPGRAGRASGVSGPDGAWPGGAVPAGPPNSHAPKRPRCRSKRAACRDRDDRCLSVQAAGWAATWDCFLLIEAQLFPEGSRPAVYLDVATLDHDIEKVGRFSKIPATTGIDVPAELIRLVVFNESGFGLPHEVQRTCAVKHNHFVVMFTVVGLRGSRLGLVRDPNFESSYTVATCERRQSSDEIHILRPTSIVLHPKFQHHTPLGCACV